MLLGLVFNFIIGVFDVVVVSWICKLSEIRFGCKIFSFVKLLSLAGPCDNVPSGLPPVTSSRDQAPGSGPRLSGDPGHCEIRHETQNTANREHQNRNQITVHCVSPSGAPCAAAWL